MMINKTHISELQYHCTLLHVQSLSEAKHNQSFARNIADVHLAQLQKLQPFVETHIVDITSPPQIMSLINGKYNVSHSWEGPVGKLYKFMLTFQRVALN